MGSGDGGPAGGRATPRACSRGTGAGWRYGGMQGRRRTAGGLTGLPAGSTSCRRPRPAGRFGRARRVSVCSVSSGATRGPRIRRHVDPAGPAAGAVVGAVVALGHAGSLVSRVPDKKSIWTGGCVITRGGPGRGKDGTAWAKRHRQDDDRIPVRPPVHIGLSSLVVEGHHRDDPGWGALWRCRSGGRCGPVQRAPSPAPPRCRDSIAS